MLHKVCFSYKKLMFKYTEYLIISLEERLFDIVHWHNFHQNKPSK